jgi:valyl-tRNA synthetase
MIDRIFDPEAFEQRWYSHWEQTGAFRPARPAARPFTIVIPPPNVTGSLHIGHALDNTLQDILIRWHRLNGRDARWVVGTDHAGIATQMVVERQLAETQQPGRTSMKRKDFEDKVWAWKEESGGTITRQLRRLGASCDWSNEQFTMNPAFTRAVIKVFVELYNTLGSDGKPLLYRDKRLVNWDPKLKTAISDLEVETREVAGSFTHIRYPLADGVRLSSGADHIIVATTRPETMLGDTAVAVHPDDARYASVIGKFVQLPITGRRILIIADEHADPELGSGAVKITPAHDFNDWQVFERNKDIGWINVLDAEANICAADGVPESYVGLSREAARKQVVADLEALGLIERIEQKTIQMPYGDRSGVVIEPWLTDQWYVNAAELAKDALAAVHDGRTRFVPATWEKTYFNWMENIQPWCVSRQLWWGHRIPAWYGPRVDLIDGKEILTFTSGNFTEDGEPLPVFVGQQFSDIRAQAIDYYSKYQRFADGVELVEIESPQDFYRWFDSPEADHGQVALKRDEDVLDTWFSSALWPFGTLGWPEQTPNLARHYPGDVLVTGFDIIFFWVARMMMQGLHFMQDVPFRTVYCHGLVRDAAGQKMSKSKGNTVDPLVLIDKYGADALRFTLTAMETQGRDIKLNESRIEGYRNFATKLWNAARFAQSNGIAGHPSALPPAAVQPVNRWIIGEVKAAARALEQAIADFRFDAYADAIYRLVWNRFCDWYLELIKPLLAEGADAATAAETRAVAGWALDQILVMLHPVMPFLTEELWHRLAERDDLILAEWVKTNDLPEDAGASADIDWLIGLISEVRSVRTELNVPPSSRVDLVTWADADPKTVAKVKQHSAALARLARVGEIRFNNAGVSGSAAQVVHDGTTFVLPLEGVIDLAAEKARIDKALAQAIKERDALAGRLNNPGFTEKAKPEAVEKAREDHAARAAEAERLAAALARLG